jgi:hypothetical protein
VIDLFTCPGDGRRGGDSGRDGGCRGGVGENLANRLRGRLQRSGVECVVDAATGVLMGRAIRRHELKELGRASHRQQRRRARIQRIVADGRRPQPLDHGVPRRPIDHPRCLAANTLTLALRRRRRRAQRSRRPTCPSPGAGQHHGSSPTARPSFSVRLRRGPHRRRPRASNPAGHRGAARPQGVRPGMRSTCPGFPERDDRTRDRWRSGPVPRLAAWTLRAS